MDINVTPLDLLQLCRTIHYSDGKNGEIVEVIPVLNPLAERIFTGQCVANVPQLGQLQVSFKLAAKSLEDAVTEWPTAAASAIKEALEQEQSKRMRQAILNPGQINGNKPQ